MNIWQSHKQEGVVSCTLCAWPPHWSALNLFNLLIDNPPHLKYVTTVPCNLSLSTTLVGDCRSFSDVDAPQGSVVMQRRCGGIFNKYSVANLLDNLTVKTT